MTVPLNQPIFQENKVYNCKIHLFPVLNTKQKIMVFFGGRLGKILIRKKILKREIPTLKFQIISNF